MKRQVKKINTNFIKEKVNAKLFPKLMSCSFLWTHENTQFQKYKRTLFWPSTETKEESTRNVAVMRWKLLLIMLKRTTWRRRKFPKHLHELRAQWYFWIRDGILLEGGGGAGCGVLYSLDADDWEQTVKHILERVRHAWQVPSVQTSNKAQ